jgi:hypothetical protein
MELLYHTKERQFLGFVNASITKDVQIMELFTHPGFDVNKNDTVSTHLH